MLKPTKAILLHGNGRSTPNDNWLPFVKTELEKLGIEVIAPQFPDVPLAREEYWMPFLQALQPDEKTILIGHSTGAIAAMRYAEHSALFGSILVATYFTDLGIERETLSGYFNRPWQWNSIKNNQQWIAQFASVDDPWIPIAEPRFVHKQLNTEYYEFTDKGHFGGDYHKADFPELIQALKGRLV